MSGKGETRASDVLQRMRDDILNCQLQPGLKLRFELLRERYGVSFSTLREALARLSAERLVLSTGPVETRLARLLGAAAPLSEEERSALSLSQQVQHFERHLIKDALKRHDGNVKAVMEELNIPRRTLNEKMQKYGIQRDNAE